MELDLLSKMLMEQMPEKQTRLERIVLAFIRSQPPLNKAEAKSVVELASNVHEALFNFEFGDDPESASKTLPDKICCWGELEGYLEKIISDIYEENGAVPFPKSKSMARDITNRLRAKYEQ